MTIRVRTILLLTVALATMGLASCDHYTCGATFGNATCTPGGTTGGGNATAYVFVSNSSATGTIDGYTLDAGAGTFLVSSPYVGPLTTTAPIIGMVVAQNKFLYAVYSTGIYGYTVASAGDLETIQGLPVPLSLTVPAQTNWNQYVVTTNPAGTLLFISDYGTDQIYAYTIGSTGALNVVQGSPFGLLFKPGNIAMDGSGKYLYVADYSDIHAGTGVAGFSVSGSGQLTAIPGFQSYPMFQMQGDPSGQYLIAITGDNFSLSGLEDTHTYVYTISATGTISPAGGSPFSTVYSPFDIAVQPVAAPGGPFIYSFSVNAGYTGDNDVEGYQLTLSPLGFSAVSGSPFGSSSLVGQAAWGGFDPSGDYLFFYSEQNMTAYSVSSTGTLTQIGPIPLTTGGYWAAVDVQ